MQFMLRGFTPDSGFRVFAFEGVEADRSWTQFTVRTDLALSRRYGISLQDLPLLCQGLLERNSGSTQERAFTFSEADMRVHADGVAATRSAAEKKKGSRKHTPVKSGSAWTQPTVVVRTPQP